MAEAETHNKRFKYLDSETELNIIDAMRKCATVGIGKINNEKSDEQYFFVTLLTSLVETLVDKFSSEVEEWTETIISYQRDKYKDLFDKSKALRENPTKQNNDLHKRIDHIRNIKNPEIRKTMSKGVDPKTIANYLTLVMEKFVTKEIKKRILVTKMESENEGCDEEYICVSILKDLVDTLITKFCSDASITLATKVKTQEDELSALFVDFEASSKEMNDLQNQVKQNNDLQKQLENVKNSKIHETKDVVIKENKYKGVNFKDSNMNSTFDGIKNCSIICRFANRNKKYEILAARKHAKVKKN